MIFFSPYHRLFYLSLLVLAGCADASRPGPFKKELPGSGRTIVLEGRLLAYSSNLSGDVDEMTILQNTDSIRLHFPPHTAQAVMAVAKPSVRIRAVAAERRGPAGKEGADYELMSLMAGGATLSVAAFAPPPPQRGEEATVSGKASEIRSDNVGRIRSFVLGNTLILLPPHVRMNGADGLGTAGNIVAKGYRRAEGNGFVNDRGRNVLRPVSIMVDSVTYVVE